MTMSHEVEGSMMYNTYWLPLLAKHLENPISDESLVVRLDCEWIWHCHMLNPIRYKTECENRYGRVLDNHNIILSTQGTSRSKTKEIWNTIFSKNPMNFTIIENFQLSRKSDEGAIFTGYDLVSAVGRQDYSYYKRKKNIKFCVPTYDVDLMWNSHQLHPESYCNDLIKLLGKVLGHDDTDSDRTKGNKLDIGFSSAINQWKETFGLSYWKAGAMYRKITPTPVTQIPFPFIYQGEKFHSPNLCDNLLPCFERIGQHIGCILKGLDLLEFMVIKNLPDTHKGNLCMTSNKKQLDMLFTTKRTLTISSESTNKQVSHCPSNIPCGTCSLSFRECMSSGSQLFVNKWLPVVPVSKSLNSKKSCYMFLFHLLLRHHLFFKGSDFSPLHKTWKFKQAKGRSYVIDDDAKPRIQFYNVAMKTSFFLRDYSKDIMDTKPSLLKEVQHLTNSGEAYTLAEFHGTEWVIKRSHGSFKLCRNSENDDNLFKLRGHNIHPYGRAIALVDFKHGIFNVTNKWMLITSITLAFILNDMLRSEDCFNAEVGYKDIIPNIESDSPNLVNYIKGAKAVVANTNIGNASQISGSEIAHGNIVGNSFSNDEYGIGGSCSGRCMTPCFYMATYGGSCDGGG
ncbi:Glycine-rich domain-containing protein 2 [Bienertia sinuspersici]